MPPPRDLTGERYGALVVIKDAGYELCGKARKRFWWCLCDCGREARERQQYLINGRSTACFVCRKGPCVICGGPIVEGGQQTNVCSDECQTTKRRRADLRAYSKRVALDPDFNSRRWRERREQMQKDGTWEDYLLRDQKYRAKYREDPANRERLRMQGAAQYEKDRDKILAQRRERWAALTPEEKREKIALARAQGREWRRKWREQIKDDPERYQDHLEYMREKGRESYGRKALREMLQIGQQLGDLKNEGSGTPE